MSPEFKIRNLLNANPEIVALMDRIRGRPLDYPPIFSSTPTDKFFATEGEIAPWIRVTLIPGDGADYADDNRLIEYPRVQIDFWIRKEMTKELSELEDLIYETLHAQNYERYYKSHTPDADIETLMMVQGNFEGFEI